jgi:hypothetical protein
MTMMRKPARKAGLDERISAWFATVLAMGEQLDGVALLDSPEVQAAIINTAGRLVVGADIEAVTSSPAFSGGAIKPRFVPEPDPESLLPSKCQVCGKMVNDPSEASFKAIGWVHNTPSCLLEDPSLDPENKIMRVVD